jgi:hypothetical protein
MLLMYKAVVNRVVSDPKPNQAFRPVLCDCSVVQSNPSGIIDADFFQPQGWVPRILLEEFEILVCETFDFIRKLPVSKPEVWGSKMIHSGEHLPASKSSSALAASCANRPLKISFSIFSSHLSEVYCSNHSVKTLNSCGGSFLTTCSNSIALMF